MWSAIHIPTNYRKKKVHFPWNTISSQIDENMHCYTNLVGFLPSSTELLCRKPRKSVIHILISRLLIPKTPTFSFCIDYTIPSCGSPSLKSDLSASVASPTEEIELCCDSIVTNRTSPGQNELKSNEFDAWNFCKPGCQKMLSTIQE